MQPPDRDRLADAVLGTSRTLLAIALRSVSAGRPDVTVVQHRVLVLLDRQGTLSVSAVAESLEVDQSNASRHCTSLERRGLVTRTRAAHDRRAVDVAISADGRRQVQAVRDARRREIVRVLGRMSDQTVAEVTHAFEAFRDAADAVDEAPTAGQPAGSRGRTSWP
ncbi:MAG TPA: MarR family transcriptional regulator [Nocardioides sp.]|jgi:DNA-binding MarR family transcriptional regulator|nr:MarR family transcriptional regulator [Nocardioides sp.]